MGVLSFRKESICKASMGDGAAVSGDDLLYSIETDLKKAIVGSPWGESDGLGQALRQAFYQFYGLEPMEDPRLDAAFLTCAEGILPYAPDQIEAAFYE